jgi:uncharacterized membrane protein YedE/YeeE
MKNLTAFAIGLLFGIGLLISGMNLPYKILGFLDVFGRWDPSLIFVMVGGLAVSAVGFAIARKRGKALLGEPLHLPQETKIDPRLLAGAVIFGVGWGLSGVCPGPAIVNLGFATGPAAVFFAAMLAGMAVFEVFDRATARS